MCHGKLDRKESNAIVWVTQHLDMPEWEDQDEVDKEEADTSRLMINLCCL